MACYHPLEGWRKPDGSIKFRAKGLLNSSPLMLPCGQCIGCRLEHSRQWAVRCVHEAKMHKRNCFLTLTYNDKHLPKDASLHVAHWQNFAKQIRTIQLKMYKADQAQRDQVGIPKSFRFFHCGEYGEQTYRPHYHALIFGIDFHDTRKPFKMSGNHTLYRSDKLDKIWGKGFVNIGELTFESAAYVARYTTKKITGAGALAYYGDKKPPYATMSRKPGIGKPWLEKFQRDVYPSDEVIINGRPTKPPRYYDAQLKKENPGLMEQIKLQRIKDAQMFTKDQTYERLATRETCTQDRIKKKRDIIE